ncbi:uncharacterized protein LOC115428797 [Sphaeramia orbicularis]|uniref:uncharacterized protein LOC115428797 n=1 Tax=Sphaeramia orbicularis TaxID=375764 RepID=UPI00117FDFF4|nr:uncharacterized protein LOC115428797 [Sphaeramia orbicularis]
MVTRNLDVEDGIVNGTFGTIRHIGTNTQSAIHTVCVIGLELDNPRAGQKFRKKIQGASDNLVYIERNEENMTKKGVVHQLFPIKLAFACTAHKVQGMTMQRAVVSLKYVFESGMGYVALSRTTLLQGLHIVDYNENKIYADPLITAALQNMPRASFHTVTPLLEHFKTTDPVVQTLKIIHHNTEGLESHIVDIKSHHELRLADILCLTETHLHGSCVSPIVHLEGYNMFTRNRHVCYTKYPQMAQKHGGGVSVYFKAHIKTHPQTYIFNVTDLEYVLVKIEEPLEAMVAAVYRPPNYSLDKFLPNMKNLLDFLNIVIAVSLFVVTLMRTFYLKAENQ